ncbi:hypothetical protein WJT74_11575 [Sphingomicrobium sp. XHP0239]|uniref:hypothetical protein n=1 Tax=Sphingomicrobium maritimum TaxID=3133972 RepID=UPI0031CC7165
MVSPNRLTARRRLDPGGLAIALGVTGAQFALLLFLLLPRSDDEPAVSTAVRLFTPVLPIPDPPPPPPIETFVEPVPSSDSAVGPPTGAIELPSGGSPRAAPAPRIELPRPIVRLPVLQRPSAPSTRLTSSLDDIGLALSGGRGGTGTGTGTGSGSGAGTGGSGDGLGTSALSVRWAPGMNHEAIFLRHYPDRARATRTAGAAKLVCEALEDDRVRDCQLMAEYPRGWGFGAAALEAAPEYRVEVRDGSGTRVYGRDVVLGVEFLPRNIPASTRKKASEQFHRVPKEAAN